MQTTLLGGALAAALATLPFAATAETLVFGTGNVPQHPINKMIMAPWAEGVNADAGGAVEITVRSGPALVGPANYIDRAMDDVVQIAWGMLVFNPGRFPRSLVSTTPFIEGSPEAAAMAFCKLYEDGAFGDEFDEYHPLFFVPFPQSSIHLKDAPITSMDDLAGKKIMVGSPVASAVVSAFGGTPLSTILPDQYQALQRGTADGTFMTYTAFPGFKLNEVTTDHLHVPLGGATGMVFMMKQRYDALPDDAKAALDAHSGCDVTRQYGKVVGEWEAGSKGFVASSGGHTFADLPQEEFEAVKARLYDGIAAGFAERVPGGAELLETWEAAVAEAQAEIDG
ncbi:TRAP transporter substrate-binding protein [Mesobacterium pallidum]|uniref:TRAP transporter substrate-binding protein n=1 Tax=Mesobacterium pallidum TaxID=2872037 RepID=UPI001EE24766|nr:TRAP transporter substrate-binding protein [Mesobacterium pallidum]